MEFSWLTIEMIPSRVRPTYRAPSSRITPDLATGLLSRHSMPAREG
jgi:hypothetical protein